jgi:uncharacterized protein YjbI with pentapeptide repeats
MLTRAEDADLYWSILQGADLSEANMSEAIVSAKQLAEALSTKGAILPNVDQRE